MRRRKGPKTKLKEECDKVFGMIVRARGRCEAEGRHLQARCGGGLQTAHIEGRRNLNLRWREWNALCLCAGHHRWFTDQPIAWASFIRDHFPESWRLIQQHRFTMFDGDYEALLDELRARHVEVLGFPAPA